MFTVYSDQSSLLLIMVLPARYVAVELTLLGFVFHCFFRVAVICLTASVWSQDWTPLFLCFKAKASDSYIARLTGTTPDQPRCTIIRSGSWLVRVNGAAALMRPCIERANEQLVPRQQLANTPPPQSTTPGLHPVSIHQMTPPKRTSNCSLLLIYRFIGPGRMKGWVGLVGWPAVDGLPT